MKINIPKAIPRDSTLSTKESVKSANKGLGESRFGLNYLSKDDNNSWAMLCQQLFAEKYKCDKITLFHRHVLYYLIRRMSIYP